MNTNEKPKTVWPGTRPALRRLLRITIVLCPLSLVIFALLVKDWRLNLPEGTEESRRHLGEWMVILVAAIAVTFLASLLPTLQQAFHRVFNRRNPRRLSIAVAWIATVVVLFYAEEDWRGWHAWNHYRQQLEGQGIQLDYRAFIPKPVPDDQNFAATPFVQSWFLEKTNFIERWGDYFSQADWLASTAKLKDEKYHRRFMDLVAWKTAFGAIASGQLKSIQSTRQFPSGKSDLDSRAAAAPAVLIGLKTSETNLAKLRAASDRPYSRYPVVYDLENPWGILLLHLANVKAAVQRLQLKACAELAVDKSDQALADVKLMLYLADSLKDEPFLISYLVRLACVQLAMQPAWEGLTERAWSDAQLQELQALLQPYDFVADLNRPLSGERAAGIMTADLLARGKYHLNDLANGPDQPDSEYAELLGRVAPRGWYNLEQLSYARLFQLQLNGAFDAEKKRVFPRQIEANTKALEQAFAGRNPISTLFTRHQFLAVVLLPSLSRVPLKAAMAQTAVDEAGLACALERYRLAKGQFPENLNGLVPQFISRLPDDVFSGEPYKYHLPADGQFVLYSVGANEQDDGGLPGKTLFDEQEGDWVW